MNRLHPLHTPKLICSWINQTLCYPNPSRGTGRSTILALDYIAAAMRKPYQWIEVHDHHGTTPADRYLLMRIRNMVADLEFAHFHFNDTSMRFGDE